MKQTWREKLADDKGLPKVCEFRAGHGRRFNGDRILTVYRESATIQCHRASR